MSYKFIGESAGDQAGYSVSSSGDIGGDGLDDFLIGADRENVAGFQNGAGYLLFGGSFLDLDGSDGEVYGKIDLDNVGTDFGSGSTGYHIVGADDSAFLGRAITLAGDVDGDGLSEILIGARNAHAAGSNGGEAYIIYAKDLVAMDGWDGVVDGTIGLDAVICFGSGTKILTRDGETLIEDTYVGQDVITFDNGYKAIRWIGSRTLTNRDLRRSPHLRPIRIRRGTLGNNAPVEDLIVSPEHRILFRSKIAERMFGQREILVAAKNLLELDGVEVADDLSEVTYWHLLFDSHELLFSNNCVTESLFTGPEALKTLSSDSMDELLSLFPEIMQHEHDLLKPVRTIPPGRKARRFVKKVSDNVAKFISPSAPNASFVNGGQLG